MELLAQLPRHRDSLSEGLQAAINVLDNDYKNLNPTSNHILEGVEAAVAFLDFKSGLLYIFSNGGCRHASWLSNIICVNGLMIGNTENRMTTLYSAQKSLSPFFLKKTTCQQMESLIDLLYQANFADLLPVTSLEITLTDTYACRCIVGRKTRNGVSKIAWVTAYNVEHARAVVNQLGLVGRSV